MVQPGLNVETFPFPNVVPAHTGAVEPAADSVGALIQPLAGRRVWAVFEPRSNTMKLGVMKDKLPGSVAAADRIYVYGANLGWDPAQVFAALAGRTWIGADLGGLVERVAADARPGDHVLVMSNGAFGGLHEKLIARLQAGA